MLHASTGALHQAQGSAEFLQVRPARPQVPTNIHPEQHTKTHTNNPIRLRTPSFVFALSLSLSQSCWFVWQSLSLGLCLLVHKLFTGPIPALCAAFYLYRLLARVRACTVAQISAAVRGALEFVAINIHCCCCCCCGCYFSLRTLMSRKVLKGRGKNMSDEWMQRFQRLSDR